MEPASDSRPRLRMASLAVSAVWIAALTALFLVVAPLAPGPAPASGAAAVQAPADSTAAGGGATGPYAEIPPGRREVRVPIVEYHYIRVNPIPSDRLGYNLSTTPAAFAAQLDWLVAHGYHTVTLADLRDYFALGVPLPARPVILTFDDGYRDFWDTAYPMLSARGMKAVAYIVPGFLNRRNYLTPAQVAGLDRTGMVEIGSHTVDHADLVAIPAAQRDVELTASRGALEQLLGHPVLDFCYPSGRFDPAVVAAVAAAGYESGTTEAPGTEHSWADRLTWTRLEVLGGESLATWVARLGRPEPAVTLRPQSAPATPPSPLLDRRPS